MSLTPEEVRHIARLARIAVTDEDVSRLAGQLSGILEHFAALARIPTDGVEPTAYPFPLANVMREDAERASLPPGEVLANAPRAEDGYLRVRAVLE
jgi:aspartyl-tRNA(Asn)/glutamyl-tRNA(Gln) amidotransferase subunit C